LNFIKLDQAVSELWEIEICPFSLIWPLAYTKVYSYSKIKQVIANGHEILNKLMTAQTP